MKRNIATINENISPASYSVPELEIRQSNKYGETTATVEYTYVSRNDKTMTISGASDAVEHIRHLDIHGREYPLNGTARLAFQKFVEYIPKMFVLRSVKHLCATIGIPVEYLYLIRIQSRYVYIEFIDKDGLNIGMKIGASGYIQVFDISAKLYKKDSKPYHLTQFARKRSAKVSDIIPAIQGFMKDMDYFQKTDEA